MSTLTEEIATYLEDNNFGEVGVDIFVMPDAPSKPDRMIMVTRTGSWEPDTRLVQGGKPLTNPMFQVMVRGGKGDSNWCEDIAERLTNSLSLVANSVVLDSKYVFINHLSGPASIGMDELMRPLYSSNFAAMRTDLHLKILGGLEQRVGVTATLSLLIPLDVEVSQMNAQETILEEVIP